MDKLYMFLWFVFFKIIALLCKLFSKAPDGLLRESLYTALRPGGLICRLVSVTTCLVGWFDIVQCVNMRKKYFIRTKTFSKSITV